MTFKWNMQLIKPAVEYKDSYLAFIKAFQADPDSTYYYTLSQADVVEMENDFPAFVQKLHDREVGKNLPEGYVPDTHWWAVINGQVVGQISLRHRLTDALREHGGHIGYAVHPAHRGQGYATQMLAEVLKEARAKGIDKVLIGCNKDNIGSKRVIEKNGGVFEREGINPHTNSTSLYFWIDL